MLSSRVPLLCADSYYIGCRVSFKTAANATAGDNIERDPPQRGPQTVAGVAITMTAPEAAIKMRLRNAASTAHSDVYLWGFPKQCIDAGVLDFGAGIGAGWKAKADQYGNSLVQGGYGWIGISPTLTSRGTVTGYLRQPDGTVLFSLTPTNGVALPPVGTKLNIKFARINRSKSILNRQLVCVIAVGGVSAQCEEVIACDDFSNAGTFIAGVEAFNPYAAVSYYRLAKRKTGRPFGVQPGRLRATTLH